MSCLYIFYSNVLQLCLQSGDKQKIPDALKEFVGKKYLFKLQLKKNEYKRTEHMYEGSAILEPSFVVQKMSCDEHLLSSISGIELSNTVRS